MQTIKLDIVSDVVCPWCFIGYKRLRIAMDALSAQLSFEIDWHPFELNPDMPPEGEAMGEHIARKYGMSAAQLADNRARMAQIGAGLGIEFLEDRRIYNTFDAHRVLRWAGEQGRQEAFNLALFDAYFRAGQNPSDPALLREIAQSLGLDGEEVGRILGSNRYAQAVRDEEIEYTSAGIHSVPAFIINRSHLISGGQEPETFIRAFREIAGLPQQA